MNTQFRKLLIVSGIALAFSASAPVFAETASQEVTEARQEAQIWTTYALNPYLRANNLSVTVHGGKATLTGNVDEGVSKDLAKQIALGVSGIKEVDNQIVVQPGVSGPAPVASAERSYGETVDDASITAAVKSKLLWSRYTDGLATDVDTNRGRVTLTGTADTGAARELAGRLAMNTRGVQSVSNQLTVDGTKRSPAVAVKTSAHAAGAEIKETTQEAGTGISDAWITAKVKSTFLYSRNVEGHEISVATKNGMVTLSGKVNSGAEKALAIELAKNVKGVKGVSAKGLTV